MILNKDFFDQIEDYSQDKLDEDIKFEFETELKRNPKLKNELSLWMEIRSAIEEKEVLTLRNKLEQVVKECKPVQASSESFELLKEFSDVQEISEILSSEELINFYDSLPKVHAYHHESTSNENIHQFYKKQNDSEFFDIEENLNDFDLGEFEGLEEAILEKDILHFRQTLKQVAKGSVEPQFSVEEIDDYINGELSGNELHDFENDMFQNRSLKNEVKLYHDIDSAICENDIMNLRGQISNILQTETSWNVSENSIEDFIDGTLEGELLAEFNLELLDNSDLMAEVELRKQINESLSENDILDLRKALFAARENVKVKKVKMLIPESNKVSQIKFWRSGVAILVVLLGLAGVLSNVDTYDNFFEAPAWSPERSVSNEESIFRDARIPYMMENYSEAVKIFDQAENVDNPVIDFYKAVSLQKLDNYKDAIAGYTKVVNHGDNMFVEEAKWFRSLCYLKLGNYEKAKMELLAVIERKGHFENDAKAIIRRLKYSFK
jgi:tetratricopeptide (TPR) repeat protein